MLLTADYIKSMKNDSTCEHFLKGVTAHIRKHYPDNMMARLEEHPEDRMTCSVIIFSRLRREIWMIGDCQGLLVSKAKGHEEPATILLENPKPYEAVLAAERAKEVKRLLAAGHTTQELCRNDLARPTILPHMVETMKQQNIAYSVVDGFPIPRKHVRVIPLDFQPWEVILASDGYPILCPTLAESEAALQHQKTHDPLNIGPDFQATKAFHPDYNSFDDRSYIRLSV